MRASKPTEPVIGTPPSTADADEAEIVQIKVWLLGIGPVVWRCVLVAGIWLYGSKRAEIYGKGLQAWVGDCRGSLPTLASAETL